MNHEASSIDHKDRLQVKTFVLKSQRESSSDYKLEMDGRIGLTALMGTILSKVLLNFMSTARDS